jgi:hypothetical protein
MAQHIPFVTYLDVAKLVQRFYGDSEVVRVPLEQASMLRAHLPATVKRWLDTGVDGTDDLESRRSRPNRQNPWFERMRSYPNFEKIFAPPFSPKPISSEVFPFVKAILDRCVEQGAAWITVPQMPFGDIKRNRINRALAVATGRWRSDTGFPGKLILP